MFRYFLNKSLKSFFRQKPFFYINLFGFSIGLACSLLLILFVRDELKYDRFHANSDYIYRLLVSIPKEDIEASIHSPLLLPLLQQEIPEIQNSVQLLNMGAFRKTVLNVNNDAYSEDGIFTTPEFFEVFSFDILRGNPEKLSEPNQIFLSENLAEKYFGTTHVIGRSIQYDNETDLNIAGVFPEIFYHSHLQFDFIISFKTLYQNNEPSWGNSGENIYLVLNPGTDTQALSKKIGQVINENRPEDVFELQFRLQPLENIYLHSTNIKWDLIEKGDIKTVIGFLIMSILILVISSFNYLNFKMAQYSGKPRNIGIMKTLGASTRQLSYQFYAETLLYSLMGLFIALIFTEIALSWFNSVTGKNVNPEYLSSDSILVFLLIIFICIFLIVAVFPPLFLSKFKPLMSINRLNQGNTVLSKKNRLFRTGKIFVFFQYIISILFAISSITIYRQMTMVTEEKLGYEKEHVFIINNPWDGEMMKRYRLFKNKLSDLSYIKEISAARNVPTQNINNHVMAYLPSKAENKVHVGHIGVDFGYFDLLQAKFIRGRNFNPKMSSDSSESIIINQELAKSLEILKTDEFPEIQIMGNKKYQLIGIVENMQYTTFKEPVKPTIFVIQNYGMTNILVKMQGGKVLQLKDDLQNAWKSVASAWPLDFSFLDERVNALYQSETRSLKLFSAFTIIAILLSCLGIYGLSVYSVQQRIKEVGIRKVFGANVLDILKILSWSYLAIVGISFLIASPIAMVTMNNWLKNFVYKIDLTWWTFVLPGILVFVITLFTISWQIVKASLKNPVEVLRYE